MCMISIQGMNCGRDNCCHGNFNFCICRVWICNSAIIRLQWGGCHIPLTHPFGGIPSYAPPCQPHALTHLTTSRVLRQGGETLDHSSARVIFQRGHWSPSWSCILPGEPAGACRQDQIWSVLPCSMSSLIQMFSNTYQFFGNARCIFP